MHKLIKFTWFFKVLLLGLLIAGCSGDGDKPKKKPKLLLEAGEMKTLQELINKTYKGNERSEMQVFGLEPTHPIPSIDDNMYIIETKLENSEIIGFNGAYKDSDHSQKSVPTNSVDIQGIDITFETGHENGLYEKYNDKTDIAEMNIYADTVTVKSALKLPQTNVSIYARKLIFEGEGQIDTTSKPIIKDPPILIIDPADWDYTKNDQKQGNNGFNGNNAGNITLYIESFESGKTSNPRFVLNGAKGQNGGKGKDAKGTVPSDEGLLDRRWEVLKYEIISFNNTYNEKFPELNGENLNVIYHLWGCVGGRGVATEDEIFPENKDKWPKDCVWPIKPGKPGNGGNGGIIYSTIGSIYDKSQIDGGKAGDIAKSVKHIPAQIPVEAYKVKTICKVNPQSYETHTANNNCTDCSPPPADRDGFPGKFVKLDYNKVEWLTPYSLKMTLAHVKHAYLYGHLAYAQTVLKKYFNLIEEYDRYHNDDNLPTGNNEWSPQQKWVLEIEQIKGEMQILNNRIEANRDYFGNPIGYVPMLSFEVNKSLFDTEIEHAIDVMYLTKMIISQSEINAATVQNLRSLADKYNLEIEQYTKDYNDADILVNEVTTKANEISSSINVYLDDLQELENRLLADAEEHVEQRNKIPAWKKATRVLGTICQACPVYQPALGGVGMGLVAASNYNPDEPMDTIKQLPNIAKQFNLNKSKEQADEWFDQNWKKYEWPEPNIVDETPEEWRRRVQFNEFKTEIKNYKRLLKPIYKEIKDIDKVTGQTKISNSEIQAEFAKLKANSPEYRGLTEKIETLNEEKLEFQRKLAELIQTISMCSNSIMNNMLAIDSIYENIAKNNKTLDKSGKMYLQEMDRRASERLQYYHYSMAKAYEYRMLKPYTGELNLKEWFDEKYAEVIATHDTEEQKPVLVTMYKEELAKVREDIINDFEDEGISYDSGAPLRFRLRDNAVLNSEEIEKLNAGETVTVNLFNKKIFSNLNENIRIRELNVYSMDVVTEPGLDISTPQIDITMEHSGISHLSRHGTDYLFRYYLSNSQHKPRWISHYSLSEGGIIGIGDQPSASDTSMLYSLGEIDNDKVMLFSRPSALGDITISREIKNVAYGDDPSKIRITNILFEVHYEYIQKDINQKDINIYITKQKPVYNNGIFTGEYSGVLLDEDKELLPYIEVSMEDRAKRKGGFGRIIRTYTESCGNIDITAPSRYGAWEFVKWTDYSGNTITTSTSFTYSADIDRTICAQYRYNPLNESENYVDSRRDSDYDGIPDEWEIRYFGNINIIPPKDSEGFVTDYDYDNDGLVDVDEYKADTNPKLVDTDGDGIPDKWEVDKGLNPLFKDAIQSAECSDALDCYDPDTDGINNLNEYRYNLDPFIFDYDTDHDGLPDEIEIQLGSDPYLSNSDTDQMDDVWEWDSGFNLSENDANTDSDGDGISNADEYKYGLNPTKDDSQGDLDGDGMSNIWEITYGLNPADSSDAGLDAENDGMTNLYEYEHLLDPNANDSEGDIDGDTVKNKNDNCSLVKNSNQKDTDSDGKGDVCDDDIDGDGILNSIDNCQYVKNAGQDDLDADSIGDICDDDIEGDGLTNLWESANWLDPYDPDDAWDDADGDGFKNFIEYLYNWNPNIDDAPCDLRPCVKNSCLDRVYGTKHCTQRCN